MKRMARVIITFMIGIYFLQYLPSIMSYISKKASDEISSLTQMAHDTLNEKINDVRKWDVGESIQHLISADEQPAVRQESTTDTLRITDSSRIKDAQEKLNQLGYDAGSVDGIWGPRTRAAMNSYQSTYKLRETDYLNIETYNSLTGTVNSFNAQTYDYTVQALDLEVIEPNSSSDYIADKHDILFKISLNTVEFKENFYLEIGVKERDDIVHFFTKSTLSECNRGAGIPSTNFTQGKYTLFARIKRVESSSGEPTYEQMSSSDPILAEATKEIMIYNDYNAYIERKVDPELDQEFAKPSSDESFVLQSRSITLAEDIYTFNKARKDFNDWGFAKLYEANEVARYPLDTVGYMVGRKILVINGEEKHLYVVVVRGTVGKAEWISNFDIGETGNAFGFEQAAKGIELYLNSLDIDVSNSKIWFCGHSRGAAVANYLAGHWTHEKGFDPLDVYGYNFACPLVVTDNSLYCPGIFNYNHGGDAVPYVPFEEWGFKRYGQDGHTKIKDNKYVLDQFGGVTSDVTVPLMKILAKVDRQYYYRKLFPLVRELILTTDYGPDLMLVDAMGEVAKELVTNKEYPNVISELDKWAYENTGTYITALVFLATPSPKEKEQYASQFPLYPVVPTDTDIDIELRTKMKEDAWKKIPDLFSAIGGTHKQENYHISVDREVFFGD